MHIEIVTPTGTAVSTDADEIVAPGSEGEFGVLPGHTPFLTAMRPGVLRFRRGGTEEVLAVGSGLVEVSGTDKVVVITDRSAKAGEIDLAAAKRDLDESDQAMKTGDAGAAQKHDWAQARIDAVARK